MSVSGGTGVLWWLYADHRNALNHNATSVFGKEVASDNVKALLVYAIGATIFTVSPKNTLLWRYFKPHIKVLLLCPFR